MSGQTASAAQPPISDYAMIGDCRGAALVASDGAIDRCALLRFDADPIFFRILDPKGGAWTIAPDGLRGVSRGYLPGTAVLRTVFETETGLLEVEDVMPVGRRRSDGPHDYVSLKAPGGLVRRLTCRSGRVTGATRFSPRREGFATEPSEMTAREGRVATEGGVALWTGAPADIDGDRAVIRFALDAGERETCVVTRVDPLFDPRERADALFDVTSAFWREWTEYSRYRGPYAEPVERSAIALRMMTYAPTGGVVVAKTTSLPEEIGGGRNWDDRYSWVRDSTYAVLALSVLG